MQFSTIITKASKSWTLTFNWVAALVPVLLEVGLQFAPEVRAQISPDYYLWYILLVTTGNKLLRVKTNSSLESK